ncbi:MAG: hypothetical protein WA767_17740, partial [Pseudolabrys sp.]
GASLKLVFKGPAHALNGVKQRSHFSLKTESSSNCLPFVKACAAFCGGFGEFQPIVALRCHSPSAAGNTWATRRTLPKVR